MQVMQCDLKCKLRSVILNASYAVWSQMQVMQCDLKCKLCIVILNASYAVWT